MKPDNVPLGQVVEWYEVPRARAVIGTPGWDGWAGGGRARRYWLDPRVLVGGAILDAADGEKLRTVYGVTHVLSAESERLDHGKGWARDRLCWCPFVDVGATIHPDIIRQADDFARDALVHSPSAEHNVIYVHCQQGGGRGPSLAYLVGVAILRQEPENVLTIIREAGSSPHPNYLASIDSWLLLNRSLQKVLGRVLELYDVPPGPAEPPQVHASGGQARRFWIHDRVLVGGSIVDLADGIKLQERYGITHVLSAESEHLDVDKGFALGEFCRTPFIDDGSPIPEATVHAALDFAERALSGPCRLYVHCQLGGSRGPAWGYLVCVGVLGMPRETVLERLRAGHYAGGIPWPNYLQSIDAGIASWKAAREEKVAE